MSVHTGVTHGAKGKMAWRLVSNQQQHGIRRVWCVDGRRGGRHSVEDGTAWRMDGVLTWTATVDDTTP